MQMELSNDLENVQLRGSQWLTRIRSVHAGGMILPDLTACQRQLVLDMLVAFRAFTSTSRWDRLSPGDWPSFYTQLTDGLTVGEFVRAEPRLKRLQAWLYERYGVSSYAKTCTAHVLTGHRNLSSQARLYTMIPLAERERAIDRARIQADTASGE